MRTTPKAFLMLACLYALAACGPKETPTPAAAPTASPPAVKAPAPASATPMPTPTPPAPPVAETNATPALEVLLRVDDTLAAAQARLGAGNVVAETLNGAEGETFPGWVLYPDDPIRRIEVFLDEADAHPAALRVFAENTVWRRADGVGIGTTSTELQTKNGKPFEFLGFDWDYGGEITDWHGGALAEGKPAGAGLTLCPPEDAPADYPSGDTAFSSDDKRMVAHPARVCAFTVPVAR